MAEQIDVLQVRELAVGAKWSLNAAVDPSATQTGWSTTNVTTDRSIDANGAASVIADGLCTLIEDLITKGVLSA